MSDKELLAQIAQVAGAINKHMNSQATGYHANNARGGYSGWGRGRGRGIPTAPAGPFNRKLTLNSSTSSQPSPLPRPAVGQHPSSIARPSLPSRHLSLVNNGTNGGASGTASVTATAPQVSPKPPPTSTATPTATTTLTGSGQQWIQSKGKNMSMMNPASYKKTMEAREKSIRSSQEKKIKLRQARAKIASDLRRGIVTVGGTQYNKSRDGRKLVMRDTSNDNVVINGVLFEMDPRGNKLVRKTSSAASVPATTASSTTVPIANRATQGSTSGPGLIQSTPKQFSMDGVVYVRTRSGNLVRASLVKDQLLQKRAARQAQKQSQKIVSPRRPRAFCQFFTRFGQCSKGTACPFVHSRSHLAICKKFLRGICPNTPSTCKLSHTPSPHTTPTCSHFQRAACNKDDCLYPHIRISPQAPICRPFATEGWCETGISCKDRHVWICPDFGTPAGCKKKCGLAHVANGGTKPKRSAEEVAKEKRGHEGTEGDCMNNKRKRMDAAQWTKRTGRYMDGQGQDHVQDLDQEQDQDANLNGVVKVKGIQYDDNFVPFDFDDEEEKEVMMDQERDSSERVDFGEQEMEEDDDDFSSDAVESEDDENDDIEEMDDVDANDEEEDEQSDDGYDEGETENEALHEELQRFYDEQDRQDNDYH
ncbi:MAG: hypothetical protein J3Q66DRAFT_355827 [Benniella sp.]|nr:MAG: hypothetical protein J3Q66DRAFT_355827 [Benniella sp.]